MGFDSIFIHSRQEGKFYRYSVTTAFVLYVRNAVVKLVIRNRYNIGFQKGQAKICT